MACLVQKTASTYRTVFLKNSCLILLAAFLSCTAGHETSLPYYNTPDFSPLFLNSAREIPKSITHTIADFSCLDQHGNRVTLADVKGKIHVANFIFTKCGSICPVMTRHMKLLQAEFGDRSDVVLLSYSVTPWIDSVPVLNEYAKNNQIVSPNWHLLTGDKSSVYQLARQSYFAEEDLGFSRDSTEFLHTEHILLIDQNLHIRGIYNGTLQLEAEQLIRDIRTLLKETTKT